MCWSGPRSTCPVTRSPLNPATTKPDAATNRLAFQEAPDLQPPDWPDPSRPQQFHLDVRVADVDVAEPQVLELGARRLPGGGGDFRVYADPVGHPFCLVWDAA